MKTISKIVVASHNEGKVREIRDLLLPFGVETVSASELNLPEPEETETTFACLLYTSPSPRDATLSRMPSSA